MAWHITEVSNSERRRAVNIGNHADLWLLKICYNTVKQLHSIPNFHFSKHGIKCFSETPRVNQRKTGVSQRTKIKKKHNSHDPLESRTLIYWCNKNYIFPCLASFRPVEDKSKFIRNGGRPQRVVLLQFLFYSHQLISGNFILRKHNEFNQALLGQVQTPYFTWAESNANEQNPLFSLICIRFWTWPWKA